MTDQTTFKYGTFKLAPDGAADTTKLIGHLSPDDQETAMFCLATPDMSPAATVVAALGCKITDVWAWRRARSIKKARS